MRNRLLDAILVHVPDKGWSPEAVRAGTQYIGISVGTAELLFPDGWRDALICFLGRADSSMSALAGTPGFSERRLHERVEQLVLARLEALVGHREAVRRAMTCLALPRNAALGIRLLLQTVDETWYVSGDRSSDFSYYTKRAMLAAVVSSTTLFWLDDQSECQTATRSFLSRRLEEVMCIRRARGRLDHVNGFVNAVCRGLRDGFNRHHGPDKAGDNRVT